jgi:hypothetical protein
LRLGRRRSRYWTGSSWTRGNSGFNSNICGGSGPLTHLEVARPTFLSGKGTHPQRKDLEDSRSQTGSALPASTSGGGRSSEASGSARRSSSSSSGGTYDLVASSRPSPSMVTGSSRVKECRMSRKTRTTRTDGYDVGGRLAAMGDLRKRSPGTQAWSDQTRNR